MDRASIREFVARRWDLLEQSKVKERTRRFNVGGPITCLEVLADLRARYLRVHPLGYSDESRAVDLAHHVELSSRLRRASHAFTRR